MTVARRALAAALVGGVAIGTAAGPAPLAEAFGRAPTASTPAGFLPEATPVRVRAPDVRITDLVALMENRPIDLAGGGRSPAGGQSAGGTVMLRFAQIELDKLTIGQDRARFGLRIANAGSGTQAAVIGGPGGTVALWGVLRSLRICLPVGVLPMSNGACTDVRPLVPALSRLIASGAELPRVIRGEDLDIEIYALRARAKAGEFGLRLPQGRVTVTPR